MAKLLEKHKRRASEEKNHVAKGNTEDSWKRLENISRRDQEHIEALEKNHELEDDLNKDIHHEQEKAAERGPYTWWDRL